jgi:hypothetical protein
MSPLLQDKPGHAYDDEVPLYRPDDGLEDAFYSPDADDDDLPDGHPSKKSYSDRELAASEESGSGDSAEKTDETDNESNELYSSRDGDRPSRFHISRNQGIAGGIAGLLIAGTLGTLTISSGPLKVLHFGQLLKNFHFSAQEDAGSDRMSKIARYIQNRNAPERSRLNRLGNTYADRIERRLNASGLESSYNKRGYGDGYVIDATRVPVDSELGDIVNQNWGTNDPDTINRNVADAVARKYGLDPARIAIDADGLIAIDSSDLGYFKNKNLIKATMVDAGLDGLGAGMRTRIMGKRAGITWHPMRKLDKKVHDTVDKRLAEWKKNRKEKLQNGETDITARSPDNGEDADGDGEPDPPDPDAVDAQADTEDTLRQGAEAGDELATGSTEPDGAYSRLRSSTSLKVAGGVTAAIGIVCTLNALANNFDDVKYANVVLPMMRAGMEAISLSEQIMASLSSAPGEISDMSWEQLGFYADQLYQAATTLTNGDKTQDVPASSAFGAASVQAEQGKEITGLDVPDEVKLGDGENFLTEFFDEIPGIDGVCGATSSIIGQVVTLSIDFAGGPVSATVGLAFGTLVLPQILDSIVNWLAGDPVNIINRSGAPYGGILNTGAKLAANDSFAAAGGRPLSGTESAQLKLHRIEKEKDRLGDRNFFARMFDVYDSGSLVAKTIDATPGSVQQGSQTLASMLANISGLVSSPLSLASSVMGNSSVAAAGEYDYGFPDFGFSVEELNDNKYQNPFDNGNAALDILSGPNGQGYIDRAEKCFGIMLDASGDTVKSTDTPPNYTDVVEDSSCSENSEEWTRIRFYIFDTQIMEAQACYEGDGESCANIGFSNSSGGQSSGGNPTTEAPTTIDLETLYLPSADVACADGTRDLGVHDGYKRGNKISIRLCAIDQISSETVPDNTVPNQNGKLAVNSRMSAVYLKVAQDALAAGITPAASEGYRTMARQEYFWNCYQTGSCNNGNTAAEPGKSNHQAGVAVDWKPSIYNWLSSNGNAQKYGLQVCRCNERWHYSPDGG